MVQKCIMGSASGGDVSGEYGQQIPMIQNTTYTLQMKTGVFIMGSSTGEGSGNAIGTHLLIVNNGTVILSRALNSYFEMSYDTSTYTITYKMTYNYTTANRGAIWFKVE